MAAPHPARKRKHLTEVQGVVIAGQLHLVDQQTQVVYEAERDDKGRLVPCGMWDARAQRLLPLPSAPESSTAVTENLFSTGRPTPAVSALALASGSLAEVRSDAAVAVAADSFPYPTEEDDHCETPAQAYHDIEPMLAQVAALLGKQKADLRIYDPFYCQGAVVRHLNALGYQSVYNKCEDFYGKVAAGTIPEYDVLVTNPPYSHDHIERLLRYCATCQRPWFVLVPNFVVRVGSVGGGAAGQAIS
jgi:hypothetical protein